MRLYADENFPLGVVKFLRMRGYDVLTAREAGRANQRIDDPDVLADAVALQRAVLTYDMWDFVPLHKRRPNHFGIIACKDDDDFEALSKRIEYVLKHVQSLSGLLVRVYRDSPST